MPDFHLPSYVTTIKRNSMHTYTYIDACKRIQHAYAHACMQEDTACMQESHLIHDNIIAMNTDNNKNQL